MKKVLLALLLLGAACLSAASLTQKLAGAEDLSVGDRFVLEIRADVDLAKVVVPDTLTIFHVHGWDLMRDNPGRTWLKVTITPLFPGSHSFPGLEVKTAGPSPETLFTDRFRLNIIPVRAEEDTLLVDIKPVRKYPNQLPLWLYIALLGLALAGLVFAMFHKPRPPKAEAAVRPLPPIPILPDAAWKLALNQLDELAGENLPYQGQAKLHHYRLSEIMRQFLERKYRFAALEMSSSEIAWVTQRLRVDSASEVLHFLGYCDRVKFAQYSPTREEITRAETWFRQWLQSFELMEARQKIAGLGGGNA